MLYNTGLTLGMNSIYCNIFYAGHSTNYKLTQYKAVLGLGKVNKYSLNYLYKIDLCIKQESLILLSFLRQKIPATEWLDSLIFFRPVSWILEEQQKILSFFSSFFHMFYINTLQTGFHFGITVRIACFTYAIHVCINWDHFGTNISIA